MENFDQAVKELNNEIDGLQLGIKKKRVNVEERGVVYLLKIADDIDSAQQSIAAKKRQISLLQALQESKKGVV